MFDHPGLLLIIVAVALLRWLAQKAKTEKQNSERPASPSQPITRGGESQTEEERIRRFLEALGQPPGSAPPKMAPPRREVQPRIFPKLPPLTSIPPPLPPSPVVAAPAPPLLPIKERIFKPASALEPGFEVREVIRQPSSEPAPETRRPIAAQQDLSLKLASSQDLRRAIVLREIFGPPRSLQLDSTLGF
jgi:hypothetical protein